MTRAEYVEVVRALTSTDPAKVRDANRSLYARLVKNNEKHNQREADLVLAEIGGP